jgi:uncharacterized protein (DUF2164 family)
LVALKESRLSMTIELDKDTRQQAIASIERWFAENRDGEKIGNIAAVARLAFLVEEFGPLIYNRAVTNAQERLQIRLSELDIELHENAFTYRRRFDQQKARRR